MKTIAQLITVSFSLGDGQSRIMDADLINQRRYPLTLVMAMLAVTTALSLEVVTVYLVLYFAHVMPSWPLMLAWLSCPCVLLLAGAIGLMRGHVLARLGLGVIYLIMGLSLLAFGTLGWTDGTIDGMLLKGVLGIGSAMLVPAFVCLLSPALREENQVIRTWRRRSRTALVASAGPELPEPSCPAP